MKKREKAAAAAVTVAAAASMVTGTLFDTPADLLAEPDSVVETVQTLDDEEAGTPMEKKQKNLAARLREWVLRLPAAVRMLVGVPMWCAGWVLLHALSVFGGSVGLGRIVGWLCLALVLLVTFTLSVKAAFPKVPFKEILRKRNLVPILVTALLLAVADLALPSVWQGYDAIHQIVWRVGSTCLLLAVCCMALGKYSRLQQEAAAIPAPMTEAQIRETALRLADTVTPGRYEV